MIARSRNGTPGRPTSNPNFHSHVLRFTHFTDERAAAHRNRDTEASKSRSGSELREHDTLATLSFTGTEVASIT